MKKWEWSQGKESKYDQDEMFKSSARFKVWEWKKFWESDSVVRKEYGDGECKEGKRWKHTRKMKKEVKRCRMNHLDGVIKDWGFLKISFRESGFESSRRG